MQTDFYRSPNPPAPSEPPASAEPAATVSKGRFGTKGVVSLVLFSAGLAVLLVGILTVRLTGLDFYFTPWTLDSFYEDENGEEGDSSDDYFSNFIEQEQDDSETTTIPQGTLNEAFQLQLLDPGEELTSEEIYARVLPSIVYIEAQSESSLYSGTGVILSEDGYLVTNYHVISGCYMTQVTLYSGASYEGYLVGYDVESDLAVLQIQAADLQAAEFGSSDQLQVGDSVVAIGNPLGASFFGTMTDGIISAIDREVNVDGYTMSLLQTSAALNPGNSGGALVNSSGQVIGITNMKMMSDDETLEGLGFAIPSASVKEVVDVLIQNGKITGRPTIGISCYALDSSEAELYGVSGGIYVATVTAGGPADRAGVQVGDVILSANGQALSTLEDFTEIRDQTGVGGQLELTVLRGEETLTLTLTLEEQADVS